MEKIFETWRALGLMRKALLVGSVVAMLVALAFLARGASTPKDALLFSGLDARSASEIIAELEADGVPFRVEGNMIFVPADSRDELRMRLAGRGLPSAAGQGYELLDNLSGFGTTSQMFDAALWRAKEGELARTILANRQIKGARVHISTAQGEPFRRNQAPTASVALTIDGGAISSETAMTIKHLVAASVAGLTVANVTVIDDAGNLLGTGGESPDLVGEDRLANTLKSRVERLMSARFGQGNAIVEVSVERVKDTEVILERRVDPDSTAVISSDTLKDSGSTSQNGEQNVTVASDLPDGDGANDGSGAQSQNNSTRERVNFEISETERRVEKAAGAIKRLSIAVMLNSASDDQGATLQPEEIEALSALIKSSVGFDESRGDQISVEAMPITVAAVDGVYVDDPTDPRLAFDQMQLLQIAALSALVLFLAIFVVRPFVKALGKRHELDVKDRALVEAAATSQPHLLPSARDEGTEETARESDPDPVDRLRELISDRRDETVDILRGWLQESKAR